MNHIDYLKSLNACNEAIRWARDYPDLQSAWDACDRGDWMLWLMSRTPGGPDSAWRKPVVVITCECARLSLPIFERKWPGNAGPRQVIEMTEAWARGEGVTLADVRSAADAAHSAHVADATYYFAAAACASAAAYAPTNYAAIYAAHAANAAATYAAHAAGSRKTTLAQCADIVRRHVPTVPQADAAPSSTDASTNPDID